MHPSDSNPTSSSIAPRGDTLQGPTPSAYESTVAAPPLRCGRYEALEVIGQGGMGVVVRARDPELARDLALKIVLPDRAADRGMVRRFVEEARLMGALQHPGVPPVHEMGHTDDGRPFFAMKLIRGRTLDALLSVRPSPSHDLPAFLDIFERIAETLGYAHSQGIIHRDLKPSNIMVGAFGEVQVMDWGLAKSRGAPPDEAGTTAAAPAPADSATTGTEAGSVLGTPAFMPPEQARGQVERLDARADVFGLGGILCVILTGQATYIGKETLRQAAAAALAGALARLTACGADAELIDLARRCLAAEPNERPRDGGAVADAVRRYRQDVQERAARAERDRAAAEARARGERRARWLVTALAASVLALGLLGGWAAWSRQQQRQREAAAEQQHRQAIESALAGAETTLRRAGWGEAEVILNQARDLLGQGPEDLQQRLDELDRQRRIGVTLEEMRLRKLDTEARLTGAVTRAYAELFEAEGLGRPSDDITATVERLRELAILPTVIAALDDWAASTAREKYFDWLLALARGLDPGQWTDRFRDKARQQNKSAMEQLAREVPVERLSPAMLTGLAQLLRDLDGDPEPVLRRALRHRPGDFWLNTEMGNHLGLRGRYRESASYYRAALALRPNAATIHNNLAIVLSRLGDQHEAGLAAARAVELAPRVAMYHDNAGLQLFRQGKNEEAIVAFRRALALSPREAGPWNNLGSALGRLGRHDEAAHAWEQGLRLAPRHQLVLQNLARLAWRGGDLTKAELYFRRTTRYHPASGDGWRGLGNFLLIVGRPADAVPAYQQALRLRGNDAQAHYHLGAALQRIKRHAEALPHFRTAAALNDKDLDTWMALAGALDQQGDWVGAISAARRALALDARHVPAWLVQGDARGALGQFPEAQAAFERALALEPKNLKALFGIAESLRRQPSKAEAALAAWKKYVDAAPNDGRGHYQLGKALRDARRRDEALKSLRRAVELLPQSPEAWCELGLHLRDLKRFAEAATHLSRGHELGKNDPGWNAPSDRWLGWARDEAAADARLTAILKGQAPPSAGEELLDLADFCRRHRDAPALAGRLYEAGLKAAPVLAAETGLHRYNAACFGAILGATAHKDARALTDADRAAWRKKALGWLTDDLQLWERRLKEGPRVWAPAVRNRMNHWQRDEDLVGVRGEAIAELPEAERPPWRDLWKRVEALRQRATGTKK